MASTGRFRVRQAGFADLPDAVRVNALAWAESYRGVISDEVIERRLGEDVIAARAEHWGRSIERGIYFWVVQDTADANRLVGVANAQPARDDDAPEPLELTMIYLLDVAKGSGIADRLLQMAIGDAPAYLWVLEDNPRAQAFYRKHGFAADGASKLLPSDAGGAAEIRMVRRAAS